MVKIIEVIEAQWNKTRKKVKHKGENNKLRRVG